MLAIVRTELESVMRHMGTRDLASITGVFVQSLAPNAPASR